MASALAEKLHPCRGGIPPLTREAAEEYQRGRPRIGAWWTRQP